MNTAVGDSFDIGWKVAAMLKGYAGTTLLASYEAERRPVAVCNMDQSGKHWNMHSVWQEWVRRAETDVCSQNKEGREVRERIKEYVEANDFENRDFGIELDYRYTGSPVIVPDESASEPAWNRSQYTPSTWPGARVPSIWLKDGKRNIYDLLGSGPDFTLVDFSRNGTYSDVFASQALQLNVPLKTVSLPDEAHLPDIWERDAVLVRPDDHVAWRAGLEVSERISIAEVNRILMKVVGRVAHGDRNTHKANGCVQSLHFTGTIGTADRDSVEKMGSFQN